jgi:hypothetical protein
VKRAEIKAFDRNSHFFRKKHRLGGTLTSSRHVQTTESLKRTYSFEESEAKSEVERATEEETTKEKAVKKTHNFEESEMKK